MPQDFSRGKIYLIKSRSRPNLVYVGSTVNTLTTRFSCHEAGFRSRAKGTSSYHVLEIGDAYIELFEHYPCSSKVELRRREGQVQQSMVCVNHNIAGRTTAEWRVQTNYPHGYYLANKSTMKAKARQQYQENREAALEYQKKYRQANPEKAFKNKANIKMNTLLY